MPEPRASVLDCGGPPPLGVIRLMVEKRRRTAAVQDLSEFSRRLAEPGHSFIETALKGIKSLPAFEPFEFLRPQRFGLRLHAEFLYGRFTQ